MNIEEQLERAGEDMYTREASKYLAAFDTDERMRLELGMGAVFNVARAAKYPALHLTFYVDEYDRLNVAVWRDGRRYPKTLELRPIPTFTQSIEGDSPAMAVYDVLEKMKHYIL